MARRMGHYYERLDLTSQESTSGGGIIPTSKLVGIVRGLMNKISASSSCLIESTVSNPFLS
jgi:hypothetical protein